MTRRSTARVLAICVLTVAAPPRTAEASWGAVTADAGSASSVALTMPIGTQATATVSGATVTVSWPASSGSVPVTGYRVQAIDATTGAVRTIAGTCAGVVATTSCADTNAPAGSWRYTVAPRRGAWIGSNGAPSNSVQVDPDPPTLSVGFPSNGGAYSPTGWNSGCSTAGICGVAADAGTGVSSVKVSIRQGTGNYWNGSSFGSATEVLLMATGTVSWRYAFTGSSFPANGSYTVRAVATDNAGNAASSTSTFTINQLAPALAITFPAADGTYSPASWNSGCGAGAVCGTATAPVGALSVVRVSVRQGSGNYWDGTGFNSSSEVLLTALGLLSWQLAFPASNFAADGTYTVRAVATDLLGNTASSSATFRIDRVAPSATITFPGGGASYGTSTWNAGCPTSGVCGTAGDGTGSGVTSAAASVLQTATGKYWNGTGFASTTEVMVAATGTTTWSLPLSAANVTNGSYTVRATATDRAGNTGTSAATTVTVDTIAPAPTAMTLYNGNVVGQLDATFDEVRLTYSEPLMPPSICSSWTSTSDQVLTGSSVVVTASNKGSNDSIKVSVAQCVLHVGVISTGGNYVRKTRLFYGDGATSSEVRWTAATGQLAIHLGAGQSTGLSGAQPAAATYTPDTAITDRASNRITGSSFSSTNQRF